MQALDLYASIEEYLDFEDEVHHLYKTIGHTVLSKDPKTLIDIGCGQGEFCHIMDLNGIKTLGVDLSAKQIEIAVSKGTNAQCIDIQDVSEKFDCATATFDVINYISQDYIEDFLKSCYSVLNDNAYFIFDINSLYGFDNIAQGTLNIELDEKFIAIDANFKENILYTNITLFDKEDKDNKYKKYSGTIEQFCYSNEELS
ncbi:methyltransferase domain-containing protein, partial [Arcobacteraceae bacterium]|nr:methyltransferase domain-containing protein [Arcobacteraceae bacterium]